MADQHNICTYSTTQDNFVLGTNVLHPTVLRLLPCLVQWFSDPTISRGTAIALWQDLLDHELNGYAFTDIAEGEVL